MLLNQCKNLLSISLLLVSVVASVKAGEFDAKKHVSYEMYCRFSNETTTTTLHQIDTSILRNENLVVEGQGDNRVLTSITNCRLNWNPNRPTRIFIHGYYSDRDTLKKYAKAYLERDDYNFIAINWLHGAQTINYVKARYRILEVGKAVARFIEYLVTIGLNLDDLTCVGHSLGAHTCGIVGKNLKSGKLAIIFALDPALPLFHLKDQTCRLHYDDAKYVQVIHTSGGYLGVKHPIGHADFYPNFGCVQPLCRSFIPFAGEICSHSRVHDLFIESLSRATRFWATKCTSYGEIYEERCSRHGERALMGGDIENEERPFGLYYLQTNGKSPFSTFRLQEDIVFP
ncbi:lipase member I-like [Sitodiplosis mosellana]|uniref:lipase member I-like n=1 Tax=Sitodiplosis mosellana TaxID=263140 RepID=UPI0024447FB9|nr:lipase member I-like [Sitodiplosis mosellana]